MAGTTAIAELTIVSANEASWEDLQAVFGRRGDPSRCWCQRYKMHPGESWASVGAEELAFRLRQQTDCDHPRSGSTSGSCAVEPRSHYERLLRNMRVPWEGRSEEKADESVWALTCFVMHAGFRRRRITHALARASVDFAEASWRPRPRGHPTTTTDVVLSALRVGSRGAFAAAGFSEVSHPTPRRVVMRIDL